MSGISDMDYREVAQLQKELINAARAAERIARHVGDSDPDLGITATEVREKLDELIDDLDNLLEG